MLTKQHLLIILINYLGMFTDLFLYGLIVPVIPFILRDRLDIPQSRVQFWTSFLLASFAGANVLFSLPSGIISDRSSSRQWPFLAGLAALFFATALFSVAQSIVWLVVARMLQGMAAAVVWTVGMALLMDTVGSENLGEAIGTVFSIISVGELLAPVVGGVAYERFGSTAVFGVGFFLIAVDLVMRILLVEKKTAAEYAPLENCSSTSSLTDEESATEQTPLVGKHDALEDWKIPPNQPTWVQTFPIVYCLRNPRLLVAMVFSLVQAIVIGVYDATLPIETQELYNFNSLQAGLLFAPLVFPNLVLGPIMGKAVDRYGTKPAAVMGMACLAVALNLLRIPQAGSTSTKQYEIVKLCVILAVNSFGLSIVSAPGVVEQSNVIKYYHLANKDFFGEQGPYAQLYAINSMFFCAGLAVGPMVAGVLRENYGYGNMNSVIAGLCLVVSILSYFYIGDKSIPRDE